MKKFTVQILFMFILLASGCGAKQEISSNVIEKESTTEEISVEASEEYTKLDEISRINSKIENLETESETETSNSSNSLKENELDKLLEYGNRIVVNTDSEEEFWNYINNNPIDKDYSLGPNVTTEERIKEAATYRDLWNLEIEFALENIKNAVEEEQYNILLESYNNWKEYMSAFNAEEKTLFYPGGEASDFETYPHVTEVEATRTKDFAIQLLSIEYAVTGKIEFAY